MKTKQLDLFNNEIELQQLVIDLHNIARRAESMGNPDGIGYSIRAVADRLSELNKQTEEVEKWNHLHKNR